MAKSSSAHVESVEPIRREDLAPAAAMGGLLVVSVLLAMASARLYKAAGVQVFENPQDVGNVAFYLVLVIAFTAVILLIARYGLGKLIRYIFLSFVLLTIIYVAAPIIGAGLAATIGDPVWLALPELGGAVTPSVVAGVAIAVGLTILLYKYPEWWVIDVTGVALAAGSAAIFGISFGLLPALLLLIGFAAYDAIAVYRTKHMIDLADQVLELRLPIMLVVPKRRGYSFLADAKRLKDRVEKNEPREAMFMGLGDIVIPSVLIVSSLAFLDPTRLIGGIAGNWVVAFATLAGTLAGYCILMSFVLRGRPQAGLPSLNGGAIVGFFLALLPTYGLAPLLPM